MVASQMIINTGTGVLSRNTSKNRDTQPDYLGEIVTLEGAKYHIAGWIVKDQQRGTFLSLSVSEEEPYVKPKS